MNPPPLLVSFAGVKAFKRALQSSDRLGLGQLDSFTALAERGLPPAATAEIIAVLFGYSTRFVMSMANKPRKHYREFTIRTGKKERRIDAPRVGLKVIQSWLGHHLSRSIDLADCVHGFVPERSTVTAAKCHLSHEWVVSLDIKDFFPSVSTAEVVKVLDELGYTSFGTDIVAKLTTINGSLPQGSPASPVLANLSFKDTDERLAAIAISNTASYTRYADDLIISGNSGNPENIERLMRAAVQETGWQIAEDKVEVQIAPKPRRVHGILVHGNTLRLPKKYRNRLRQIRYALANADLSDEQRKIFEGHVAYASAVYGGQLDKL